MERLEMRGVLGVVEEHLEMHPRARVEDMYVLVYQAIMGPVCGVVSEEVAFERLSEEIQEMELHGSHVWEDALSELGSSTGMVRVHLRPYLRVGGSARRLARAMVGSAARLSEPERVERLGACLGGLRTVLRDRIESLDFTGRELDLFLHRVASERFPVVHHSEVYCDLYDPHYRVVVRSAFEV